MKAGDFVGVSRLRRDLGLPDDFNPVPYCEIVNGGGWSIRLPGQLTK